MAKNTGYGSRVGGPRPSDCSRDWPGYWCSRGPRHDGPCALRPKWWNLPAQLFQRLR